MTIEETIRKAVEGGWRKGNILNGIDSPMGFDIKYDCVLDPLFWQSLGKAMGWNNLIMDAMTEDEVGKIIEPNEWKEKWHWFIEDLIRGKTIESFFEQL